MVVLWHEVVSLILNKVLIGKTDIGLPDVSNKMKALSSWIRHLSINIHFNTFFILSYRCIQAGYSSILVSHDLIRQTYQFNYLSIPFMYFYTLFKPDLFVIFLDISYQLKRIENAFIPVIIYPFLSVFLTLNKLKNMG